MIQSIILNGLAVGAVYAMIGVMYNVMYTASRVFSFTAGMVGMLGGVIGSMLILKMGMPVIVGLLGILALGAVLGSVIGGKKGAVVGILVGGTGGLAASRGEEVDMPEGTILNLTLDRGLTVRR